MRGRELSRRFYVDVVRPLLDDVAAGLSHAAALLGPGSDVLGFDDEMSTDHGWGPRVDIFLDDGSPPATQQWIAEHLGARLPSTFGGYPVYVERPGETSAPDEVRMRSRVLTPSAFFQWYLGVDPASEITVADWLTLPAQKLRTVAAGPVFHDAIGLELRRLRLTWYPHDVWLYLLAAGWTRIGQEEHLMGRAGAVGDEVGSALIGARLVRDLMRLCFLMERQFAPYPKWFGTAFRQLASGPGLVPYLQAALVAVTWTERERSLVDAYERAAVMHNTLGITDPIVPTAQSFFGRPFATIATRGFASAIAARIVDPAVRVLLDRPWIGGIDQVTDSTDMVETTTFRTVLRGLYA